MISIFYEDKITQILIHQINKNIETEILIDKSNFSIFKNFPYASVTFYNVRIKSIKGFRLIHSDSINSQYFLNVSEVSIKVNIWDIICSKYIIKGLVVKNGYVNILINANGEDNYQFWNKNLDPTANKESFEINIKSIETNNIKALYLNELKYMRIQTEINRNKINIKNNQDIVEFEAYEEINSFIYHSNDLNYNIKKQSFIYFSGIYVSKLLKIEKGTLEVFDDELNFNIVYSNKLPYKYLLNFESPKFRIGNYIEFIPKEYTKNYKINGGKISLKGKLEGAIESNELPKISANINFSNVSSTINNNLILNKLNGFVNIKGYGISTYNLTLQNNLNGELYNSTFTLIGSYNYNVKQIINVKGNINLDITDLNRFKNLPIKFNSGNTKIDYSISGLLLFKKSGDVDFNSLKTHIIADIHSIDMELVKAKTNILLTSGKAELDEGNLNIENLNSTIGVSHTKFNGSINNILSLITDSIGGIDVNGNFSSSYIDVNKLMTTANGFNDKSKAGKNLPLMLNIKVKVDTIIFNKININNLMTSVTYSGNTTYLRNSSLHICNGNISDCSVNIDFGKDNIVVGSKAKFNTINIKKLFKTFDNFGQNEMTSDNIEGNISGLINTTLIFNSKNNIQTNKIQGDIDFTIENGELNNFKPIYNLSKFIEVEELNSIKFSNIKNKISVANNIITIPLMDIGSSALNLSISGQHTLNNEYEYHFKVLLSDILFKKAKKKKENAEFGKIEEDTLGRTSLFIKIKGQSTDFKISYDNKEALKSFSNKVKVEKNQLKSILKEEFGLFKNDSSLTKKKEVKKRQTIESDEFKPLPIEEKPQKAANKKKQSNTKIEWHDE